MLSNAWEVGRILGFRIRIHVSLVVIFALLTFSLALGVLPVWHGDWPAGQVWGVAAVAAALFLASILVHELSHSVVARAFGIPVEHITLFLFGGVSGMEREPDDPASEFLIAIVGPLTSVGLGIAFLWLGRLFGGAAVFEAEAPLAALADLGALSTLLLWLGPVNIFVGLFNLLPGFPLDGGRMLRAALWHLTGDLVVATRWAAGGGSVLGTLFLLLGVTMAVGIPVPVLGQGLVGGLWAAMIGLFLRRSARSALEHTLLVDALRRVPVEQLMDPNPARVSADVAVPVFVADHLIGAERTAFVVERGGRVVGLVDAAALEEVPARAWAAARLGDLASPLEELASVAPDDAASDALLLFAREQAGFLPVVQEGRLVGVLHLRDLFRWASWQRRGLPTATATRRPAPPPVSAPPADPSRR